jgi:hypothetical protein
MAFYQKLNIRDGSLVWLLLQPSDEVKRRFQEVLGSQNLPEEVAPVVAPFLFLSVAAGQWRSYLEHLEGEVHKLVRDSRIGSLEWVTEIVLNRRPKPSWPVSSKSIERTGR